MLWLSDQSLRLSDPDTPEPIVGPFSKIDIERKTKDETYSSKGNYLVGRCYPWRACAPWLL
jgi:hypothetical protein